ncbi:heavy metal translocating P-type ATPase [Fodinibius salsisoli]|uniref:Heavy metal translocating P-type ATPase metal-binding domain-containing protein n=1 Tax=Fodinibius salsisoli TaxID=2820877 RepID=A0ABT3PMV8_9BACT|nr:heavy metal translocating P-type ATPase metal-binding domain-containing protein [Fodinibius salsisoli]MCW9707283.1 heavy metal translocating P-type ATPase metal-binding domain-containing protein [Fodinibius salsisoli]
MNSEVVTANSVVCYHCGNDCNGEVVHLHDKPFCCSGCKMVFQILDDNELNTYYSLEDQPGISFKTSGSASKFDYLNDPQVRDRLVDFKNDTFVSVSFYIPNIHCTSCIWLLENLFKLDSGIIKSSVNFLKRELSISYEEDKTSLRSIVKLLASIGYEPELRLEKLDAQAPSHTNRKLWLKLGVAGFAFGNIMLFSFPEYLSGSSLNTQGSFYLFFGILNIILAIPVLLYSSSDYLKSAWAAVRQGNINLDVPISIGILSLFTRSVYEITAGIGAGYMDSLTGLVFFLLIGRLVQQKTYERLSFDRDYKSYLPISVTSLDENDEEHSKSIDQLKEGTRIVIRNNELVPADSVLLSEHTFVDYSFITGESEPVEVQEGETVYAGGKLVGAATEMRTVKEVSNSYLTKLWNDSAFDESSEKLTVSSLADRISPHFTLGVLAIAINAGILWWTVSTEMALTVFTAVLIIACPCALALSTPFTLGSALNIFARNGFFIKGIDVIERLANTTAIVFDKTGTLTKADHADVSFQGEALSDYERGLIQSVCKQSVHPLSRKIADHVNSSSPRKVENYEEKVNKGISATVDGKQLLIGSTDFISAYCENEPMQRSTSKGDFSVVHIAIDGHWKGWFEVANHYRTGIKKLLDSFRNRFSTFLLSGDNDAQKNQFTDYFNEPSLRFNQTPQQKLNFIKELQENNQRVVMIGDGLNDAGALKQSDFGIALTDNVSSFTPACDAIIDGSKLQRMDTFINFSQVSITIIKLSFGLSLIYNIVGLGFAVSGQLSPLVAAILMPLSSISIMIFTTCSTHYAAKKMGLQIWK